MKPDFSSLTQAELRAYTIAHPDNPEAFHAFVDRFTAEASPETFNLPNTPAEIAIVDRLIKQKLA
jgi:hypothetical protein